MREAPFRAPNRPPTSTAESGAHFHRSFERSLRACQRPRFQRPSQVGENTLFRPSRTARVATPLATPFVHRSKHLPGRRSRTPLSTPRHTRLKRHPAQRLSGRLHTRCRGRSHWVPIGAICGPSSPTPHRAANRGPERTCVHARSVALIDSAKPARSQRRCCPARGQSSDGLPHRGAPLPDTAAIASQGPDGRGDPVEKKSDIDLRSAASTFRCPFPELSDGVCSCPSRQLLSTSRS